MGYNGSGKSTLARALGRRYGCPVLYLDTIQFEANWRERDRREAEALATAFLNENESWVIDGSYMHRFSFQRRCEEADWIIQLLLPRRACLCQAVKRYFQNRGKVRDSMAAGCVEKFDFEFLCWLLWEGRTAARREEFQRIAVQYPEKVRVCLSPREAAALPGMLQTAEEQIPH